MKEVDYGRKFVEILYNIKKSPREILDKISKYDLDARRTGYTDYILRNIFTLHPNTLHYLFEEYNIDANWYISDYGNMFMPKQVSIMSRLTGREREVINMVLINKSRKEIADSLNMGIETVKWHFKKIFQKLGVHSQKEIVNLVLSDS